MAALRREAKGADMPLLLVIGTPSPPEIVEQISRRAADGGVAGDVRVLPQQRDIHQWMQAADLLVSGSHEDTEGLSRVLYEAMACGTVPVATDIRGNRDALTAATGVLVPERTPLEMARAIRFLLDDPIRRARMGASGIARARDLFGIQRHARQVEEFYEELVERGGTRVVGGPRGD
jgi:glycosyltransferase involved in cell wall biosynthesis